MNALHETQAFLDQSTSHEELSSPTRQIWVEAVRYFGVPKTLKIRRVHNEMVEGAVHTITVPISKDNVYFAIRSCDTKGHCSAAVAPAPEIPVRTGGPRQGGARQGPPGL